MEVRTWKNGIDERAVHRFGTHGTGLTRQAAARALPSTGMDNGMTERARSKTIPWGVPGVARREHPE
jgi:hypothetical protein